MKLKPHQQQRVDENPSDALWAWEMRSGKTLPATLWASHPCRNERAYIICLKQNKEDWKRYVTSYGNPSITVLTKEEYMKADIENPTALVLDEAHRFSASPFYGTGSNIARKTYALVKENPDCNVLLLTATPIKNDPWSLHTLLCYIGIYYDWKVWRKRFYELEAMPWIPRQPWLRPGEMPKGWVLKPNWRALLQPIYEQHADILYLKDIVKDLPEPIEEVVAIHHKRKHEEEAEHWTEEHMREQEDKAEWIQELGFRKLLLVVKYTDQIDALAEALKDKPVFVLDGRTKDADAVKRAAQEAEECYFIVQSSMGFGFDGYMFGATVFVSMSHACVDHTQMRGRARNLEHLNPVIYYYLIGGKWDRRIYETVMSGQDFYAPTEE